MIRTVIADRARTGELLDALAARVVAQPWAQGRDGMPLLVGIREGGVPIARALAHRIASLRGSRPETGALDVAYYRDDTWLRGPRIAVGTTDLPGDLTGRHVLLVDDVLWKGRTVRAALDALVDFGRPRAVRLAVLVDRGGRELPIAADAIGWTVDVPDTERVEVACDGAGQPAEIVRVAP